MPAKIKTLDELFHDTLKDIYFAEKKILTALPKMAKAGTMPTWRTAFQKHREQTEGHVNRLERYLLRHDRRQGAGQEVRGDPASSPRARKSWTSTESRPPSTPACSPPPRRSISASTCHGTLRTWAEELGLEEAASSCRRRWTRKKTPTSAHRDR